ncbi:MAG: AI-2E family transporter [Sulfurovum sp.]|nr:AI-2E family transporter [Sulfurovum sp.]
MKQIRQKNWPINQILMFWVMISILLATFKFASELIVPFLIAIALAIILSPLLTYLERKRIPKVLSLVFIIIVSFIPAIILGGYIGEEVKDFANNFQEIKQQFNAFLEKVTLFMNGLGLGVTQEEIHKILEKSNLGEIVKNLASQAGSQFSNIFLIFFMLAFMLMESDFFYNKMIKITKEYGRDIKDGMKIIEKIKSYFLIKVKTSLMTAVWILAVLWYYDVSYFYLWATLAFFLNFIPVIGSIIAAVPPIAMALIDQTAMTALWVGVWYMVINTIVGNIIEPRIMGKGLGLSALVIFLSMTFWGWIFGPAGMILSVPLTMVVQFLFEQYRETQWIALLLSDYEKEK